MKFSCTEYRNAPAAYSCIKFVLLFFVPDNCRYDAGRSNLTLQKQIILSRFSMN